MALKKGQRIWSAKKKTIVDEQTEDIIETQNEQTENVIETQQHDDAIFQGEKIDDSEVISQEDKAEDKNEVDSKKDDKAETGKYVTAEFKDIITAKEFYPDGEFVRVTNFLGEIVYINKKTIQDWETKYTLFTGISY